MLSKTSDLRIVFVLLLMLAASRSALAQEQNVKYSKEQLQQMYMEYLKTEGYVPSVDDDGDVQFKSEGSTFWIIVDEEDTEYFRLIMPNFWPIESEEERLQVFRNANAATRGTKVAKVFAEGDNVVASLKLFVEDPDDFQAVFTRSLSALHTSVREFVSMMRKEGEE